MESEEDLEGNKVYGNVRFTKTKKSKVKPNESKNY